MHTLCGHCSVICCRALVPFVVVFCRDVAEVEPKLQHRKMKLTCYCRATEVMQIYSTLAITNIHEAQNSKRIHIEGKYNLPSKKSLQNVFLWSATARNTTDCAAEPQIAQLPPACYRRA